MQRSIPVIMLAAFSASAAVIPPQEPSVSIAWNSVGSNVTYQVGIGTQTRVYGTNSPTTTLANAGLTVSGLSVGTNFVAVRAWSLSTNSATVSDWGNEININKVSAPPQSQILMLQTSTNLLLWQEMAMTNTFIGMDINPNTFYRLRVALR